MTAVIRLFFLIILMLTIPTATNKQRNQINLGLNLFVNTKDFFLNYILNVLPSLVREKLHARLFCETTNFEEKRKKEFVCF